MNRTRLTFKSLIAAAGLGLALLPGIASADTLPDFTIDPTALGGPPAPCGYLGGPNPAPCVGDKLTGNYNEVFSVTGVNGLGGGSFATVAYWDLSAIVGLDATKTLLDTGLLTDYGIYALFSATGTFSPNAEGGFDFTATGGSLQLYADLSLDSGKTLPATGTGTISVTNAGADDPLLASAPLVPFVSQGHTTSDPEDDGDFSLTFQPFTLTLLGTQYFIAPNPFYMTVTVDGVFRSFVPSANLNQTIDGVAEGVFASAAVPEPASMTLLGLGLAGAAAARRRRQRANQA
jgi:hypothetical protein